MRFFVPIRLPSLANVRMSWRAMARLKKYQRQATALAMKSETTLSPSLPLTVTITRVGPRKLDDDNLQAACKYVRDEIAATIGTDDGSPLYTWRYAQRVGRRGEYGVEVEIVPRQT